MEALRISPQYKAEHWRKLDKSKEEDWPTAAAIVHDRLHGRFLKFADMCLKEDSSGFVVLSIDCLLVETLQQFIEGETRDWSDSERSFKRFLAGPRFATSFIPPQTRRRFYLDIRCGLLHQAAAMAPLVEGLAERSNSVCGRECRGRDCGALRFAMG